MTPKAVLLSLLLYLTDASGFTYEPCNLQGTAWTLASACPPGFICQIEASRMEYLMCIPNGFTMPLTTVAYTTRAIPTAVECPYPAPTWQEALTGNCYGCHYCLCYDGRLLRPEESPRRPNETAVCNVRQLWKQIQPMNSLAHTCQEWRTYCNLYHNLFYTTTSYACSMTVPMECIFPSLPQNPT